MKHSSKGNFTVYEESDICSLDEYSETIGEELEDKFEEVEQEIEESAYDDTEVQNEITILQTENTRLKATLPTTTDEGENITLSNTAELEFIQPPLPRGNSEQVQYSGKNKLPNALQSGTSNGVNYTINQDKSITLNGTNTSSSAVWIKLADNFTLSAGTYTMSNGNDNASTTTALFADDGANFGRVNKQTKTFETDITVKPYLYIGGSATFNNFTIFPMIEQGSTATSYEPYCGGTASPNPSYPQEITNVTGDVEVLVQNKNLFRVSFQKGNWNANGTYNEGSENNTTASTPKFILKAGSYIISNSKITRLQWFIITWENNVYNAITKNQTKTFTLEKDTLVSFQFNQPKGEGVAVAPYLEELTEYMMLEQGSTATTYTPHKEQTFTFPLGTQRMYLGDYLADDGIHHVRAQEIIDENLNIWTSAYGVNSYVVKITNRMVSNETDILVISTHFKGIPANQRGTAPNVIYNNTANQIEIRNTEFETLNQLKTWLENNNVTIEYILEQEEITPYTTEQQQAYDEIKQAISYEEQTNISGSSDESNPIFSVEAYQSTKLILENIDSRLTIVES